MKKIVKQLISKAISVGPPQNCMIVFARQVLPVPRRRDHLTYLISATDKNFEVCHLFPS
jgi:hypothetical protein